MLRELEISIGTRIDAALDRIRSKVCLMGMAGKWHIGKASDLLNSPNLLGQYVGPLTELEEAKYLDRLPGLIAETKEQDRHCAQIWDAAKANERHDRYRLEQQHLIRLFLDYRFHPKQYECLVRQPDKPNLREAIRILEAKEENAPGAIALERVLRMRLRDFVLLEEGLADDFRDLDEAREELCKAHQELALRLANSQSGKDELTVGSAMVGLRKAAGWYDYKRGYSFEEYAEHWVREAIDKRRK